MRWEIKIEGQDNKRVHFVILKNGQPQFENDNFSKYELIELITEGNYDCED
jgi:hypothetical protein